MPTTRGTSSRGYQLPPGAGLDPDQFDYAVNRLGMRPEDIIKDPSKAAAAVTADIRKSGVSFAPAVGYSKTGPQYDLSKLSKEEARQLAAEVEDKGSITAAIKEIQRQPPAPSRRVVFTTKDKEALRQIGAEVEDKGSIAAAISELQSQGKLPDKLTKRQKELVALAGDMAGGNITGPGTFTPSFEQAQSAALAGDIAGGTITGAGTFTPEPEKIWNYRGMLITNSERKGILKQFQKLPYEQRIGHNPVNEMSLAKMPESVKLAAEIVIPGIYTAANWKGLSPAERALWLGVDAASLIIPAAGGAFRGARAVGTAGKLVRLKSAAKGAALGFEAGLLAPVDMVIHPVGTAKAALKDVRNVAEILLKPKRLQEAVITTSTGTVRLKVNETTTPKEALQIRDRLMGLVAAGERPIVEIGGTKVELTRSPLMRELGGGLAHSTPSGEAFEGGLKVATKPGMPLSEQGLFLSNEPLPRFAQSSAFGKTGERPSIIIFSKDTAKQAVTSGKLYNSQIGTVAELEAKFAVGTDIPELGKFQRLTTRVGPFGTKVDIYLEKPLKARQIARLKAEGILEYLKAPFKEPIKVGKGAMVSGLADDQLRLLQSTLARSGNIDQARTLARAAELAAGARLLPPSLTRSGDTLRLTGAREVLPIEPVESARVTRTRPRTKETPEVRRAITEYNRAQREMIAARDNMERVEREYRDNPFNEFAGEPPRLEAARERVERAQDVVRRAERQLDRAVRDSQRPPNRGTEPGRIGHPDIPRLDRVPPPDRPDTPPPGDRPPDGPPGDRPPDGPPPPPPPNASDSEKREYIKAYKGGMTTYNMGQLKIRGRLKDVWHVYFDNGERMVLFGKAPAGTRIVADGPGSTSKTTQRIGNRGGFPVINRQHGAVKATVRPAPNRRGASIAFNSVRRHRQYYTPLPGGGVAISKQPMGRKR